MAMEYAQGDPLNIVAARYGSAVSTVSKYAKMYSVEKRLGDYYADDPDMVLLYMCGVKVTVIAGIFDRSRKEVYNAVHRAGIQLRWQGKGNSKESLTLI